MAKSTEIDDIFANKSATSNTSDSAKAKKGGRTSVKTQKALPEPVVKPAATDTTSKQADKLKSKASKTSDAAMATRVETVVDPSSAQPAATKRSRPAMTEEDAAFGDSRGTTRRRTDDGLPIYDAAELKIGLGGDTPLCPFDCDCCF
ncbi:uncharacterized protein L969DRAFT_46299 [Mixia osmundae IAM 14324]|uniref:DUF1764 domain-containing protein n=1 Tax=Mixia osmundae (strain CBS 9802 / IAM 14324 / JCM 22182 / KY 12970) TaxID=764103 RepID=G7E643_MIXOS|nr:uncharacterized protein L969DRAFT_46299 [Mixia osmundae IAM 14324]KEI40544.1 hypothetical protein L969DRAFT_46299 [Mixia osmundae IAM 14324]GAA98303.1 hypothetical protein E5Q_04987 [Mixia osmundae IAM 14324]